MLSRFRPLLAAAAAALLVVALPAQGSAVHYGCNTGASLTLINGTPTLGATLEFEVGGNFQSGTSVYLLFGAQRDPNPCGTSLAPLGLPNGNLLMTNVLPENLETTLMFSQTARIRATVPNSPMLVGVNFVTQSFLFDSLALPAVLHAFTNAYDITIGA